ncbi:hypothetical protein ACX3U9_01860 [Corynebacterium pyruviciproducens]
MSNETNTENASSAADDAENTAVVEENTDENASEQHNDDKLDDFNAETFKKKISKLNHENARYRSERNAAREQLDALVSKLAKISGNDTDDEVSPEQALEKMRQERDSYATQLRALNIERDVTNVAREKHMRTKLLLTLLKGEGKLAELNPESEDYRSQVERLIDDAVQEFPELKTQAVSQRSGQPANSQGVTPKITAEQLEHMSAKEIYAAQKAGKLNHILKGDK